ncbi:MAG: hypothetical protein JRD89_20480 [Deltaproteobacteria bacterium]|nr:hypothetical protein [Deltaproteobacteria bacterium]
MSVIQMAADSVSLVLNGTPITDFAEGDVVELNYVNPKTGRVNSANGGVNIGDRVDGGVMDMVVRVQKYSASDVFLNSASNQEAPTVFNGSVKEDFIRDDTAGAESYILENGSFTTRPGNVKNNTDQNAMMEYTIQFRNATRNI